jgi:hypothetical protein
MWLNKAKTLYIDIYIPLVVHTTHLTFVRFESLVLRQTVCYDFD